jgi:hypothetical protein
VYVVERISVWTLYRGCKALPWDLALIHPVTCGKQRCSIDCSLASINPSIQAGSPPRPPFSPSCYDMTQTRTAASPPPPPPPLCAAAHPSRPVPGCPVVRFVVGCWYGGGVCVGVGQRGRRAKLERVRLKGKETVRLHYITCRQGCQLFLERMMRRPLMAVVAAWCRWRWWSSRKSQDDGQQCGGWAMDCV